VLCKDAVAPVLSGIILVLMTTVPGWIYATARASGCGMIAVPSTSPATRLP
jgi:hypothetical protein